jgi:hypothetical protein
VKGGTPKSFIHWKPISNESATANANEIPNSRQNLKPLRTESRRFLPSRTFIPPRGDILRPKIRPGTRLTARQTTAQLKKANLAGSSSAAILGGTALYAGGLGSRAILENIANIEHESPSGGNQQGLSQPDFSHELAGDPERQDQETEELQEASKTVAHGKTASWGA